MPLLPRLGKRRTRVVREFMRVHSGACKAGREEVSSRVQSFRAVAFALCTIGGGDVSSLHSVLESECKDVLK